MTDSSKAKKTGNRVLLPSYVKPQSYDLKVSPDMAAYTFDGLVSISMATAESFSDEDSKKITLHSKELMYRSAEFQNADGSKTVKADEVSIFEPNGALLCRAMPTLASQFGSAQNRRQFRQPIKLSVVQET